MEQVAIAGVGVHPFGRFEAGSRERTGVALATQAERAGFTTVPHAPPGAQDELPYHIDVAPFCGGIGTMGSLIDVDEEEGPTVGAPLESVLVEWVEGALTDAFRL